ncbi:MAG: endonuclease IV [Methanomassiliicoccales archaeon PtaU1.Bin124]|nr:MAG: endonuclease IV [Methanomassiliicoccales archaeon PtaU1.Bin124]
MIALSSPALSLMPLAEAIELVARDFKAWEIVGEGKHFLPDIEKELAGSLPSYELEMSVHSPLSDINIGSLNPRLRQAALSDVLRTVECAGRLGLNPITVHPGFLTPLAYLDREGAKSATKDSLRLIEKAGKEHGVTVALENMPDMPISMITTPKALKELLDGTELSICFDIGHAHTTHNVDAYLEMHDRFANIHIHDNDGRWDQHLPIGMGSIDFPPILRRLASYKGRYVIEARELKEAPGSQQRLKRLFSEL